MTIAQWVPGVCALVAWPIDGAPQVALPGSLPSGQTFASVTVTSYAAVAAPGGASVITHERPVLLTIPADS
jgi:hypothetical protein